MNKGAQSLLGLQDFRSYCKPREGATTIRELQKF
jgi:tRNA pseudouridine38-40 synthase